MYRPIFEYTFSYAKRNVWIILMNRGFDGETGRACAKLDTNTSITRDILFGENDNFAKFLDICPVSTSVCTVGFGPMWVETLFWNSLPKIDKWLSHPVAIPDAALMYKCQVAVNTIINYGRGRGFAENYVETQVDIPFIYIKWIMCEVHKTSPIKSIYYSPSSETLHVKFKAGSHYTITTKSISNESGIRFHYNNGFKGPYPDEKPWTVEMEMDYEAWKLRQDTDIFNLY
jgi:hypothetical protein